MIELKNNDNGLLFSACRKRFVVCVAGRRSGKTERAKRRTIERAIIGTSYHTPRFGACGPTHTQAKAVFWEDLKRETKCLWVREPSESELTIYLKNSYGTISELCVRGLDKPQRIEGIPWDWLHIDEADDIKPGFWEEHLRPCLSDRGGGADFTGVPEGFGFLYTLSQRALTDPDYAFFSWPSSEVLSPEEIASARRDMDERTFRQEYEASFEALSNRVYYAFSDANIKDPVVISQTLSAGMDFNVVPYLPVVIFFESADETWIVDEIKLPNGNTDQAIQEMKTRYGTRITTVFPDPAGRHRSTSAQVGRTDLTLLAQAGYEVKTHPRTLSVKDGINATNARLCNAEGKRRLFVSPKCKMVIDCLRRHGYKKGTSIPDEDAYVHCCDAVRYPCEYLHPITFAKEWKQ